MGSIDSALREAEAALGPLPPVADAPVPPEVAPFVTGVVATPHRLAEVALGPIIAPGSQFLKLLVVVEYWSFTTLRLPDVVRRVISALGLSVGEVVLVEQSRPELIWPIDIILRAGGNAILSGRWRAFALGHRLRVGDRLIFRFGDAGGFGADLLRHRRLPHLSPARDRVKGRRRHGGLLGRRTSLFPSFVM
jgi:hypothetical protein